MSSDALLCHTLEALDRIFQSGEIPPRAPTDDDYPEDSPLAFPDRTTVTLSNGEVIQIDLFQVSASCWSAKNADHDSQCGWGETRERAIRDLYLLCEDELDELDIRGLL